MKTTFKIEQPDNVECSMTVTMGLRDWRKLRESINESNHSSAWEFGLAIRNMVDKATRELFDIKPPAEGP